MRDHKFKLTGAMRLRDVFLKPLSLLEGNALDNLIRGLAVQPLQEFNNVYTKEVTEFLFPEGGKSFGMDLVTLNVQRGRDHQIPGYAKYR